MRERVRVLRVCEYVSSVHWVQESAHTCCVCVCACTCVCVRVRPVVRCGGVASQEEEPARGLAWAA